MHSKTSTSQERVDLEIDLDLGIDLVIASDPALTSTDPYQNLITEGLDSEFLRILCSELDVGVSILDEDLNYKFISKSVFSDLNISTEHLKVGDPLSRCHELMLENGMLTEKIMAEKKLSQEDQLKRAKAHEDQAPAIVTLGNGSTHKFLRKILPNGHTISMSTNVTELVEKDHILEEALVQGSAAYWTYDFKTKEYYLSQSLRNFFSKDDLNKIQTQGIISIVHPDDKESFRASIKRLSQTNEKFEGVFRSFCRKGHVRWFLTTWKLTRDADGKPQKLRSFNRDITRERKQANELERAKDEAIAASHAKSEFLANMSHEIRTPMNGILGMAELLANSTIDDRQREFVNVINNSASALLTIINDILDFSKIEAGAFKMDPMPFNLKDAVSDVTSMLTPNAQEKGLELIVNYPTYMSSNFIGDGGRIRQVITNLIGNAIKFTKSGHIISNIDVSEANEDMAYVTISVTDTGIGIEPEKLSTVFQKFTQADNSTTRVYGGTGLGLSISKAIVEIMGGRLSASSTLGEGSTFTARIPLPVDQSVASKIYDTSDLAGKRALIVDDIKANRSVLMEQLASWDIKSDAVNDGIEAFTRLKTEAERGKPYDLIILDFLMPGINGQQLAAMITKSTELPYTPIVMLSSCDQPISSQDLQEIGISRYLLKPAREGRLYEAIIHAMTPSYTSKKITDAKTVAHKKSNASTKTEKIEILVAEDFSLNQDVVRLMLTDTPYKPVFVNNGAEAVETYKVNPARFPVIVMDVSMPVMDGYEATKLIQIIEKAKGLPAIPIIALTGHALKNDREDCLSAGMCDYLSKPVKQSELIDALDNWVAQSRASLRTAAA